MFDTHSIESFSRYFSALIAKIKTGSFGKEDCHFADTQKARFNKTRKFKKLEMSRSEYAIRDVNFTNVWSFFATLSADGKGWERYLQPPHRKAIRNHEATSRNADS